MLIKGNRTCLAALMVVPTWTLLVLNRLLASSPGFTADLPQVQKRLTTIDRGRRHTIGVIIADVPVRVAAGEVRGNMIQVDGEQWLSTPEVLDALNISRSTLYAMRRRGEGGTGPKNIKLGRCLYFSQRTLSAWLHSQEEQL